MKKATLRRYKWHGAFRKACTASVHSLYRKEEAMRALA
jgi:hypothetical protein